MKATVTLAALGVTLLGPSIDAQSGVARATGSCLSMPATTINDPGDSTLLSAPAGELIAAVSVKAGRKCFVTPADATGTTTLDDCYVIEGLASAEVTVRRIASQTCKPISNIQFVTAPAGEPDLCGDALDNDRDGIVDDGCIGGRAWFDRNVNALQDLGEPGLAGVPFRLRTSDGTLVASTLSDATGAYHFGNVAAGTYSVDTDLYASPDRFFTLTGANRGTDDTLDSDFAVQIPGSGGLEYRTLDFAFPPDGVIEHIDAGFLNARD